MGYLIGKGTVYVIDKDGKEHAIGSVLNLDLQTYRKENTMTPENLRAKKIAAAILAQAKNRSGIPTVVCLCGSTKFYKEYVQANYDLTMKGKIVLSVGFFGHAVDAAHGQTVGITPAQKGELDELHKRKIDLADEVFVINVDGYVGESTRSEIEYAQMLRKPIYYLQPELVSEGVSYDGDLDAQVLRNQAGGDPCLICLEIGFHNTDQHEADTSVVPVESFARKYDRVIEEQHKLADAIADQPEGIFNAPDTMNLSLISRTVICINRLKELAGTFWKDAEGCKTFAERQEKLKGGAQV